MTPAQQKKALKFLKDEVLSMDRSNHDETGYCNHEDVMKMRIFLIEVGAMPDRRKARDAPHLKNLTPWKPGQSGNPAGKPKGAKNNSTVVKKILAAPANDGKAGTLQDQIVRIVKGEICK